MGGSTIENNAYTGIQVGLGLAVIPAATTAFIACSKIIFVTIIANLATRIIMGSDYTMEVEGLSFVSVPLLWKVSLITAVAGLSIAAISFLVLVGHTAFSK